MMKALKEYNEMIMRPSWGWLKRHWKGYSVFCAIVMVVPYVWFFWDDIKEYIRSKFKKTNGEES